MAPRKKNTENDPQAAFMGHAFGFFSRVLDAVGKDVRLGVLWGVEVILFLILALMALFGNITGDQRYDLALVIIASVALVFIVTMWLMPAGERPSGSSEARTSERSARVAHDDRLNESAQKCMVLLTEISEASGRILRRGSAGTFPWKQLQTDTYNHVCHNCYLRRHGTESPDPYFDGICAEPDIKTVCDNKWLLGEVLEDYRNRLKQLPQMPPEHDALELLIRRSVTQPDCSPAELEPALRNAIAEAKRVLASSGTQPRTPA